MRKICYNYNRFETRSAKMNMKHLTCKFTMAITVIACLFALPARATEADGLGDIYEIFRSAYTRANSSVVPFTAGDSVTIVMRMLSANPDAVTPNTWNFKYVGPGSEWLAEELAPPELGIVVGGKLVFATYDMSSHVVTNSAYTDLSFTYRVQAGDVARPIKLALEGSTADAPVVASVDQGASKSYYIKNVNNYSYATPNWALKDESGNVAKFLYCTDDSSGSRIDYADMRYPLDREIDYTLDAAKLYVQSVVLGEDEREAKTGKWEVGQGAEALLPVTTIGTPAEKVTLYAWSADETAFTVVPDSDENKDRELWNPSGKTLVKETHNVFMFSIAPGATSASIPVLGKMQGKTANLVLSTADNYMFDAGGSLVSNFIVRAVTCTEPPPPSVSFKFDGGKVIALTDASTEDVADINNNGIKVTVTLSEPFGEAADIQIKATLKDDPTVDVFAANMVGLQVASNEAFADPPSETNITMSATATSATFYVYPLGGNDLTSSGGILFTPVITNATLNTKFGGNLKGCTLRIADNAPTIVKPTSADKLSGTSSAGCKIPVMINDCYRDMTSPDNKFDVSVDFSDSGHFETNGVVFLRNVATTILADGFGATATSAVITVTDAQGNSVVSETIPLSVPKEKTISAELAASTTAEAEEGGVFDEGTRYNLRFRLGPDEASANVKDMYAFLLPLNEASSNLVETTATTNGVLIQANKLVSSTPSTIKFLDGNTASGNLKFRILLRGGDSLTDPVIDSYKSEDLYLVVNNVAPTVSGATVGGDEVSNGGTATIPAYAGQNIDLTITAYDPVAADLKPAIPGDVITAQFKITDGDANNPYTTTITTNFATSSTKLTIKHPFNTANRTQTVTVRLQDKDMDEDEWGPEYTFKVNVKDAPSVKIFDWNGNNMAAYYPGFMEVNNGTGSKNPYVTVELSPAPIGVTASDPIVVKLDVTNLGDGTAAVTTNYVELTAVKPSVKVYLKDLNGVTDSNFSITAKVTNDNWCDYYETATGQFSVSNVQPSISAITGASESITNNATLGTPKTLTVTVSDVSLDVGSENFKIVWTDELGIDHYSTATNYNVYGSVTNSVTASWEFTPKNEGTFTISVAIDDGGSNGRDERILWFYVKPCKYLEIGGMMSGDAGVDLSRTYRDQAGVGKGRAYVTGTGVTLSSASYFNLLWNCGTASSVKLWAYGYKNGQEDDGTLGGMGDVPLDPNGMNIEAGKPSGSYYKYDDVSDKDSFFYGWITAKEAGSTDYSISVNPEAGTVGGAAIGNYVSVNLPTELTGDDVGYVSSYAEAVFSKEYKSADNLGDIDNDGIPDIFALKKYANGAALAVADGLGGELGARNAVNTDEDYLPGMQLGGSTLIPGSPTGWSTRGRPFTARMEIRGFDNSDGTPGGLNYGMFQFDATEKSNGWVSDLDLTYAEKVSLLRHVLARRDAILERRYTKAPGIKEAEFDGGDWVEVTNVLATLIRSDTSYITGPAGNARPAYITGFADKTDTVTNGWSTASGSIVYIPFTNDVIAVKGQEALYPAVTNVTTNVCWVTKPYTTSGYNVVALTNVLQMITNEYVTGTTTNTDVYWQTPFDRLTVDDFNVNEWLNIKANPTAYSNAQVAVRAYLDRLWNRYLKGDTTEWGWTCENRTDPTVDDTDGDGMPDGYEYYIWYGATVGTTGSNRFSGYRLDLTDRDSKGVLITPEEIARLYNPNVAGSVYSGDTDGDGITDFEEFTIGTNPLNWDTDGDGLSDGYELTYNMDPLSASGEHGCDMNTDGDFMAFVDVADNNSREELANLLPYKYIYTATNGTTWAFSTNLTSEIRYIAQRYPATNVFELAGVKAFKVGKYGVTKYTDDSGVTKYYDDYYIPATEKLDKLLEFLDPDATAYEFDSAWTNADTFVINPQIAPVTLRVDKRNNGSPEPPDVAMGLFHHQVHSAFRFDPRTGWYSSDNGLSKTARWKNNVGSVVPGGAPQNTVAYTAKYEYNLPKYLKIVNSDVVWNPTNPGVPYEATSESEDGEISHYMTQHGADTDADGVPDGWELYIGVDPGVAFTSDDESTYNSIRDTDKADGLTLAYEFAGTDSCGVYSECASIYKYHPSQDTGTMKNWYNKFFPTDPRESDSDGDSIDDGPEGKSWRGEFVINRIPQTDDASVLINYFSIYGSPADDGTTSIRGGGYNPCTIDTDSDGLPDPWERQFTGVLFKGMTISDTEDMSVFGEGGGKIDEWVRKDIKTALVAYDIPTNVLAGAEFYHILMGMDGTVADAATSTVLGASDLDWDGDGLQNWQEYLVQAMRQFRYDDDKTPLLGRDCPNITANGETPGSWNGDKGFLKVSYTEPFTDVQLDFIDGELGYHNFAVWAKNTENYLKDLGYFIDPPMAWDHARNTLNQKYMLPPANIRYYTYAKGKSQATDGNGNAIYTYELAGKLYEFTNNVSGVVNANGRALVGGRLRILTPKMVENSALAMDAYTDSPRKYFSTDPRRWDTDADGMDDYYELFHGLNPILGEVTREAGMHGTYSRNRDIIARATDGKVSPGNNAWIGWANEEAPVYDPIRYPWLMGAGECDADSDGLRNFDESLLANVTSPNAMHTDPTPLWMTDASVKTRSSEIIITTTTAVMDDDGYGNLVQVWNYDPKTGEEYPVYVTTTVNTDEKVDLVDTPSYTALFYENELKGKGVNNNSAMASLPYGGWQLSDSAYAFSFEQNEGYDTDNDWRSDGVELKNTAEGVSDPLNFADPQRRQSVWFGGVGDEGMLVSREDGKRTTGGADLFKQFTVEAWARPENAASGKDQYIVSRAVYCSGSSLVNPEAQVRLDFALGLDGNGRAFAEIMNSVDVSYRITVATNVLDNIWTHLSATFDGSTFVFYVNGNPVQAPETTIIPANGTTAILQNPHFVRMEGGSYRQSPSMMAVGARPVGETVFNIANVSSSTVWSDLATDFFKGSVDEVRCWDGARTADEVKSDYRTRYTPERVKENRLAVYDAYIAGGSRNDNNGKKILPPELIHHYDFSTLAGAHDAAYVQQVPAGFGSKLLDSVRRPDTGARMDDLVEVGWWRGVVGHPDIGSKVYTSPNAVPRVQDTVAHLPKLCGSVVDSVFWSENFAGYVAAEDNGLSTYSFPNSMNPYNVVETLNEYSYLRAKLAKVSNTTNETANLYPEMSLMTNGTVFARFYYDNRRGFSGNSDLIPLGSAYAKRLTESWDGQGAETAWATTTTNALLTADGDADDNGIADWAESKYASAREYARALAKGLLPTGVDADYENTEDVDGDGLRDWWEKFFGIYAEGPNDDHDRDGLSNYQEYLIGEVYTSFGFGELSPVAAYSKGTSVTDYFLRYGSLYLGELFSDHDMIEDKFEDYMPSVTSLGGTLVSNFSRWIYDADWDAKRDGWDNWSIARAWFNESYVSNVVTEVGDVAVTNEYLFSKLDDDNGNPSPKINICVSYKYTGRCPEIGSPTKSHQFVVKAWNLENGKADKGFVSPDCTWGGKLKGEGGYFTLTGTAIGYSASQGAIKPGKNMFVAYIAEGDFEEGGTAPSYQPGMPYGVAYGVEIGSIGGGTVNIELTDTNPSVVRIDIPAAVALVYGNGNQTVASGSTLAETLFEEIAKGYTDRGRHEPDMLRIPDYIGEDTKLTVSNIHVRILRAGMNGEQETTNGGLPLSRKNVLLDRNFRIGVNHVLTEADLLASLPSGEGDLDWGLPQYNNMSTKDFTNAVYRVVVGDGTVSSDEDNNNLIVMFYNKFEFGTTQTAVSNMTCRTFAGRPTFSWTHANTISKDYPAFRLRVWDGGTPIYDSGVQRAPVRDQAGYYNWAPPLYVGSMLSNDKVFEPNKDYKWSVSMLDAKFTTPLGNEEKQTFKLQETSPGPSSDDYGIIKVAVKYMGPGAVSTNKAEKCIRVEAFTTPDFTGEPAGVGFVTDATTINSTTNLDINATIVGLPQKTDKGTVQYYVRAFLDTDVTSAEGGYGKRAPWESWGYASYRDPKEDRYDCFTPCAITATNNEKAEPCVVFIEDCDTNRNMVPDILETSAAGANTLYSPYIAYTASDTVKTNALVSATSGANGDKNSVKRTRALLAFASAVEAAESGTVTAGELAVLYGGISFETVDSANIKITSFSLEEGISLEVNIDGTFDGAVSAGYDTGLINVTVEYSKTLENGGDWQRAGDVVTLSFSLTEPTTKIEATELEAIKAAIESVKKQCSGGCYFRVSAVAFER